ncbi:MAG: class I SAM-dependent methyltransferase [Desulfovibrionaceae bacterium]|nr:class I SAM-dependent methyltransferase [Desulfovibrionaceae bacterium]
MDQTKQELRFAFGKNWSSFLQTLDDERIREAERDLVAHLGTDGLKGKTFLDIGSGSGLHSLAARRLGARVVSFDYDKDSVACTAHLRDTYFPGDADWRVEQGSALDRDYMAGLGRFDIVYSWGVLHHTGDMWTGLENAAARVAPGGTLFLAIYNDQGGGSSRWKRIKRFYNQAPAPVRLLMCLGYAGYWETRLALIRAVRLQNPLPFKAWRDKKKQRGMSYWHDVVDWMGGYPFEVARPEEIFDFHRKKGFVLRHLATCGGGIGCNEFVFSLETAQKENGKSA